VRWAAAFAQSAERSENNVTGRSRDLAGFEQPGDILQLAASDRIPHADAGTEVK
jgi:hypothetical protein